MGYTFRRGSSCEMSCWAETVSIIPSKLLATACTQKGPHDLAAASMRVTNLDKFRSIQIQIGIVLKLTEARNAERC